MKLITGILAGSILCLLVLAGYGLHAQDIDKHIGQENKMQDVDTQSEKKTEPLKLGDVDMRVEYINIISDFHRKSIGKAKITLSVVKNPEIIAMATELIETQKRNLLRMQAWMDKYQMGNNLPAQTLGTLPSSIGQENKKQSELRRSEDIDARMDYIDRISSFHMRSIDLAKTTIKFVNDPEIKAMAEELIETQEKDLLRMQAWKEEQIK